MMMMKMTKSVCFTCFDSLKLADTCPQMVKNTVLEVCFPCNFFTLFPYFFHGFSPGIESQLISSNISFLVHFRANQRPVWTQRHDDSSGTALRVSSKKGARSFSPHIGKFVIFVFISRAKKKH